MGFPDRAISCDPDILAAMRYVHVNSMSGPQNANHVFARVFEDEAEAKELLTTALSRLMFPSYAPLYVETFDKHRTVHRDS